MATYKVIQDIEAEDHILGPLTLRQFIFALIAVFFFYMSFLFFTKGVVFLDIISLPPALFFGFFAVPFGRDQPTEIWALAKLRFFLKPRRRIWDQSGVKELVTITVPKRIERQLTDGLTQYEVQSRLKALANTLDTRGWSVKNSLIPQTVTPSSNNDSDRLLGLDSFSSTDSSLDQADVMDDESSQMAQQFAHMIDESSRSRHQQLVSQMNSSAQQTPSSNDNQWFMPSVSNDKPQQQTATVYAPDVESGKVTEEESALSSRIKESQQAQRLESNNLRTLQPIADRPKTEHVVQPNSSSSSGNGGTSNLTARPDPAILSLANSDDLSVQAIAHEAKRAKGDDLNQDEVVISLH